MRIVGAVDGRGGSRDSIIHGLIDRLDGEIIRRDDPVPKGTDMFLSWRFKLIPNLENVSAGGTTIVCLDLGYFDETKFERYSISINGVHGLSMPVKGIAKLPARPKPKLHPWRKDGEFIQIIAPGHPSLKKAGDIAAAKIIHPEAWAQKTALQASAVFGKPAKIRYHPRKLPPGQPRPPSLESTFEETFCSVTYASTTAIQTIIAGVPTVIMHPRSPAFVMGTPNMEIVRPRGRAAWLHDLSYREYDMIGDAEFDHACDYLTMGLEEAQAMPRLRPPLTRYGIH
jgi:hypothetical protein